jgi:DNA-binding NarL/FixJ family response regulator
VADHTDISVVLGVGGARRAELAAALGDATLVLADEPGAAPALDATEVLVPDVVLLDEHDGRALTGEACRAAALRTPAVRLVVLVDADDELAYELILEGAFATVDATSPPAAIVDAVRAAARGESTIVAGSARRLLEDARRVERNLDPRIPALRLTATEEEVLGRRSDGLASVDIAALHDVTARLVNLHMGYAVAKLHHHVQRARARDALSATPRS